MTTRFGHIAGRPARSRRGLGIAAAALALLLHACGADTLLSGVGSGGSGIAEGTVTGLGSIYVDGTEFDDSAAPVQVQDERGALLNAEPRIGQRVRIAYEARNTASSVEILPQLIGPVSSVHGGGWLRVMNQWVRVLDQPAGTSPATVLDGDGYRSSADVALGDLVEVHGDWSFDGARGGYVLTATRLARRTQAMTSVRLGGIVAALDPGGFRLNETGGTLVLGDSLPPGLAVGSPVQVWAPFADAASPVIHASRVRAGAPTAQEGQTLLLGGIADAVDPVARTITVQGVTSRLPEGFDAASLGRGDFVRLTLRRSGQGWTGMDLQRRGDPAGIDGAVVLKGAVSGVDWSGPAPLLLSLRGTALRVDGAVLAASSCSGLAPDALVYVEASAPRGPEPLVASAIACGTRIPPAATVERTATVVAVDSAARTLSVRTGQGEILTVWWNELSYLGADPRDLLDRQVSMEIRTQDGQPTLRRMRAAQ